MYISYLQPFLYVVAGVSYKGGAAARRCRGDQTCGTAECGPEWPRSRRRQRTSRTDLFRIHLFHYILIDKYEVLLFLTYDF